MTELTKFFDVNAQATDIDGSSYLEMASIISSVSKVSTELFRVVSYHEPIYCNNSFFLGGEYSFRKTEKYRLGLLLLLLTWEFREYVIFGNLIMWETVFQHKTNSGIASVELLKVEFKFFIWIVLGHTAK